MEGIRPYVVVQDWMLDLGLNPSEVMAVAVIYGFTQDGEHWCHASVAYFGRMCGLKRSATVRMLRRLVASGLVKRREMPGKVNEYTLDVEGCTKYTRVQNTPVYSTTKTRVQSTPLSPAPPIPVNKDNKYNHQGACDAHVLTREGGPEGPAAATPQPPSPPVPSGEEGGLFFVSSVQRDSCGFDPDRIAGIKRERMAAALDRAAARLEGEGLRMSREQRCRFLDHWCAHRPGSEEIRAEGDRYFSLDSKARIWLSSDAERAASKPAAGGVSGFADATSDWRKRGDF